MKKTPFYFALASVLCVSATSFAFADSSPIVLQAGISQSYRVDGSFTPFVSASGSSAFSTYQVTVDYTSGKPEYVFTVPATATTFTDWHSAKGQNTYQICAVLADGTETACSNKVVVYMGPNGEPTTSAALQSMPSYPPLPTASGSSMYPTAQQTQSEDTSTDDQSSPPTAPNPLYPPAPQAFSGGTDLPPPPNPPMDNSDNTLPPPPPTDNSGATMSGYVNTPPQVPASASGTYVFKFLSADLQNLVTQKLNAIPDTDKTVAWLRIVGKIDALIVKIKLTPMSNTNHLLGVLREIRYLVVHTLLNTQSTSSDSNIVNGLLGN